MKPHRMRMTHDLLTKYDVLNQMEVPFPPHNAGGRRGTPRRTVRPFLRAHVCATRTRPVALGGTCDQPGSRIQGTLSDELHAAGARQAPRGCASARLHGTRDGLGGSASRFERVWALPAPPRVRSP